MDDFIVLEGDACSVGEVDVGDFAQRVPEEFLHQWRPLAPDGGDDGLSNLPRKATQQPAALLPAANCPAIIQRTWPEKLEASVYKTAIQVQQGQPGRSPLLLRK